MKNHSKLSAYLITAVILAMCIAGSTFFALFQHTAEPENPLNSTANPSQMLMSYGNGLNVSETALDSAGDSPLNKNEPTQPPTGQTDISSDEKANENPTEEQSNSEQQNATQPASVENIIYEEYEIPQINTNSAQSVPQNNTATDNSPSAQQYAPTPSGNTQPSSNGSENHTPNTKPIEKPTVKPTENKPNNEHNPSSNVINSEYFTTSIKNGETVHSRHYSFTITHKNKKLNVKELCVYINTATIQQFNGSVLLDEGENTIRVLVVYTDSTGKEIPIYKDYTVNVDLGEIIINTTLTDRAVDSEAIEFTADAVFCGESIPLSVTCNSNAVIKEGGTYKAKLDSGENVITLSAQSGSHKKSLSFTIISTATQEFSIYTNLTNSTVNSSELTFTAYCKNGSENARLSVKCNGKALSGSGNYTARLKIGSNTIRLKATDRVNGKNISIDESYIIKYIPQTTPETAPRLNYINVTNNMTIRGNRFTLDLQPIDYLGNRIFYDGISVVLNGISYQYKWTSEYTSYLLNLQGGTNVLEIRITDNEGRFADYSYNINCIAVANGEKIGTITISADANVLGLGYILPPTAVEIHQGETTAQIVQKLLEENGFVCHHTGTLEVGYYLSRIEKEGIGKNTLIPPQLVDYINDDGLLWTSMQDDNSLGETDYTQGSGWMYTINGSFQGAGLSDMPVKDGDILQLRFTLAYGKDIGGYKDAVGDGGDNYPTIW